MNVSVIRGRLVADPVIRYNDNKTAILDFTVAVNKKDRSDFIDCVAWGNTAEFIERNFEKGQFICVVGEIRTHVWEKADGVKAKDVKVSVSEAQFG